MWREVVRFNETGDPYTAAIYMNFLVSPKDLWWSPGTNTVLDFDPMMLTPPALRSEVGSGWIGSCHAGGHTRRDRVGLRHDCSCMTVSGSRFEIGSQ